MIYFSFIILHILYGNEASSLMYGEIFSYQFTANFIAELNSERILKIG